MRTFLFKKTGFTLAEVLITLGIIGVVAAMTIPNLVSNFQKKIWTAQLKRSYAVLNQGFRRMLADDGASLLSQTETFNSIGGDLLNGVNGAKTKRCQQTDEIKSDNCEQFYNYLGRYFKIANIKKYTASDGYYTYQLNNQPDVSPYTGTVIMLMDGTMIQRHEFFNSNHYNRHENPLRGQIATVIVDVNGVKRPNKWGRDIFQFIIGDNGIAYPRGSMAVAEYWNDIGQNGMSTVSDGYWKTATDNRFTCKLDNGKGLGCAARVLETGKMDY